MEVPPTSGGIQVGALTIRLVEVLHSGAERERLGVGMTSGQNMSGFRKPLKRGKALTGVEDADCRYI